VRYGWPIANPESQQDFEHRASREAHALPLVIENDRFSKGGTPRWESPRIHLDVATGSPRSRRSGRPGLRSREPVPGDAAAHRTDFRAFEAWCSERGVQGIPAAPETVASFLAHEAQRGLAVSSISRRAAAIRLLHRAAGHAAPTESELVRSTLRGIRRTLGVAPKQKKPLTSELLLSLLEHIPDSLRGKRDLALLLLGFSDAFRRSTLAILEVSDLEEVADGLRVHIRHSKTDQEGRGAVVPIIRGRKACPVAAVKDWMASAEITRGPVSRRMERGGRVFPQALTPFSIGQIVKRYVKAAGLDPSESGGHSLRAGFITSAVENGASVFRTMDVSLHRRVETLRGYVRRAEEFKDHAGDGLL
jgi:site-specific recombinase XerD